MTKVNVYCYQSVMNPTDFTLWFQNIEALSPSFIGSDPLIEESVEQTFAKKVINNIHNGSIELTRENVHFLWNLHKTHILNDNNIGDIPSVQGIM